MRPNREIRTHTPPIPLTVVCEPRGSETTSLVKHLVTQGAGTVAGVFVDLPRAGAEPAAAALRECEVLVLRDGAICAGGAGPLDEMLIALAQREPPPNHVVVELGPGARGAQSPRRALGYGYTPGFRPDGVVTVVHSNSVRALAESATDGPAIMAQLMAANVVVLDGTHAVSRSVASAAHRWVQSVARQSLIVWSGERGVAAPLLLGAPPESWADPDGGALEWSVDFVPRDRSDGEWGRSASSFDASACRVWRLHAQAVSARDFRKWAAALPEWVIRASGTVALREMLGALYDFRRFGTRWDLEPRPPRLEGAPTTSIVLIGLSSQAGPRSRAGRRVTVGPIAAQTEALDRR